MASTAGSTTSPLRRGHWDGRPGEEKRPGQAGCFLEAPLCTNFHIFFLFKHFLFKNLKDFQKALLWTENNVFINGFWMRSRGAAVFGFWMRRSFFADRGWRWPLWYGDWEGKHTYAVIDVGRWNCFKRWLYLPGGAATVLHTSSSWSWGNSLRSFFSLWFLFFLAPRKLVLEEGSPTLNGFFLKRDDHLCRRFHPPWSQATFGIKSTLPLFFFWVEDAAALQRSWEVKTVQ